MINFAITPINICALFGTSNVFEVAVENKSTHMDSLASKFRRMSLVDNLSISQDGGTSAAFDMNDKVEVKENPDKVRDNLVPETEFKENSGRRQRKLNKK